MTTTNTAAASLSDEKRVALHLTTEQVSALYLHLVHRARPDFGWIEVPLVGIEEALKPVHNAIHDRGFNAMNRQFFGDNRFAFEEGAMPNEIAPVSTSTTPQADAAPSDLASMTRMFQAACADLGAINEALGLDPDDGGAAPILDAIAELKSERDKWVDAGYAASANASQADAAPTGAMTRTQVQGKAIEHGFQYWRAPDAHGVTGTKPQAIELLQDLLGVEVEIEDNGCQTCNGTGMIGGPSYYAPDEGGMPCPECAPAAPAVALEGFKLLPVEPTPQQPSASEGESDERRDMIADALHYPQCWDTAAYPTLNSAIWETVCWSGCGACKDARHAAPAVAPVPAPVAWRYLTPTEQRSLQWLNDLCEPNMYLDRLGPIRDWVERTLSAPAPAEQSGAPQDDPIRVECRECRECDHVGINDGHETDAACGYPCGWSGPSPKDDTCPGCARENVMSIACPKCSGLYHLIAESDIPAPLPRASEQADEAVTLDAERYRWLRNPSQDVSLVLDKVVGETPLSEDGLSGGYKHYEYRSGDDLDAAIDAARAKDPK
jgi:hypothetical protein